MKSIKNFLKRIDESRMIIEKGLIDGVDVDCIVYLNSELERNLQDDALQQLVNVAGLPHIVKRSIAMPDIHSGYGFPIGGVAAFDFENGIISPGGVGYDINCGIRCLLTNIRVEDLKDKIKDLLTRIFLDVPTGIGSDGRLKLSKNDLKGIVRKGALWAVENGYGFEENLERIESGGFIPESDFGSLSEKSIDRGLNQQGTLGSGNHFLEVDYVSEIFDEDLASSFGLFKNQIAIMLHTGSRGFGHQVCSDYVDRFTTYNLKEKIILPDKQLVYASFKSVQGKDYYYAMNCAANYAFCNREIISFFIKNSFEKFYKTNKIEIRLLYDVAHNIAKVEEHIVDGKTKKLIVHRKGATRSFPKGHKDLTGLLKKTGQPVLIPGDMVSGNYIMVGGEKSLYESFGSTAHGAGRLLSRNQSQRVAKRKDVIKEIEKRGVFVLSGSKRTIFEEIPEAYKDIENVVETVKNAGLSYPVVKLLPIGVIKG